LNQYGTSPENHLVITSSITILDLSDFIVGLYSISFMVVYWAETGVTKAEKFSIRIRCVTTRLIVSKQFAQFNHVLLAVFMSIEPLLGRSKSMMLNTVDESIMAKPTTTIQSILAFVSYPKRKAEQKQSIKRKYMMESGTVACPAALRVAVISIMSFKAGMS